MALTHARPKRWTVDEYRRLYELGAFKPGERVELIDGQILAMTAQGDPHKMAILRGTHTLVRAFDGTHYVGVQIPVHFGQWHAPEPDFSVFPRDLVEDAVVFPERIALIIEVADTSLAYDRNEKSSLYASAGIPEYWIVNLRKKHVEVYRDPCPDLRRTFKWGWRTTAVYRKGEEISPAARQDASIAVADLF